MLQLGEEAAAFDGRQLPVVAGEDQFCTGALRFGHQLACDATVEHRRLIDDHDAVARPVRQAVLESGTTRRGP